MVFFARLKRNSNIYRNWRSENRVASFIDGVFFNLKGFDFVTDQLEPEQVDKIRVRQDQAVELEMVSVVPPVLEQGTDVGPSTADQNAIPLTAEITELKRPRLRKIK